jgi:6-phosphofructokinase 1
MRRIGILTSGGDAPGMNAAIRAAVRSATSRGIEVVGYLDGFAGLVSGAFKTLDDRAVGNIIQRGGTVLGTSRCPEFLDRAVRARAVEQMRAAAVDGLIVVGGDGSFRGALALQEEQGLPVVGVPGTIDNDVYGTDETIGFDTAVNTAMFAIDKVRDTGESTGMAFFVEVMGRTSGAIALSTAVAVGAIGVLVPEANDDLGQLIERIEASLARGKRSNIIVVAEGDEEGGAFAVAERVARAIDLPHRVVVLGHIQRGGSPTARDRVIAAESAALAVQSLADGDAGVMIGVQGRRPVSVLLTEVVAQGHPEPEYGLLQLAQSIAG